MSARENDSTAVAERGTPAKEEPPAATTTAATATPAPEHDRYNITQANGQRKYGGPPPGWSGAPPPRGCEVFVGKIPRDCYEDELVPVFERVGPVYELRLMMDFSGSNRGYAFVTYTTQRDAQSAVREINNYEIRKGRSLGVCRSIDNCRLFVGGIPKTKTKNEILTEIKKVTENVVDVIVYPSATDKSKNRGFAFVEYESHRAAAVARRKLIPGKIQLWGHQIAVDWAEPEIEVDEEVMQQVKILYVRNLMLSTTEDRIRQVFTQASGKENVIDRVKKIRDYAFVHFIDREDACNVMSLLNGTDLDGAIVEVVLAKPADKVDARRGGRSKPSGGNVRSMNGRTEGTTVHNGMTHQFAYETAMMNAFYSQLSLTGGSGPYLAASTPNAQLSVTPSQRNVPHGSGRGSRSYLRGANERGAARGARGRSAVEVLEEVCSRNGWLPPIYQPQTMMCRATNAADGEPAQLFLCKVVMQSLMHVVPGGLFMPNQTWRTADEAKQFAADFVLMCLRYPTTGVEVPMMALPPPPLATYPGHQLMGPAGAHPAYSLVVPTEHGYAYVPMPPPPSAGPQQMVPQHVAAAAANGSIIAGDQPYDASSCVYAIAPAQYATYA